MGVDYCGGWDAVIATSFANVNRVLAYAYTQNVIPHGGSGQFQIQLGPAVIPATITAATVAPWTMTGGTGQNVVLSVPFTGGSAVIGNVSCSLANVALQVQVLLRMVRSTLSGGSADYQLELVVTDPSAIISVGILNPPAGFTDTDTSALAIALRNLLQTAIGGSGVIVATLDLGQIAQSYPWLVPNQGISYAAASNSASPGDGQLGLLLATQNPPPGIPPTLVAGVIPPGCTAALVISNLLFSQNFLAPAFASSLNVAPSAMSYAGRNPTTVTMNGNGSVSGATITSAVATANDNSVAMTLQGNKSPSSGITVNFTINATYAVVLSGTAGNPVLSFQRTSESDSHSTDIAWWVWVASGGAIGAIIVAIIQAVVNGAAGSSLSGTMPAGFVQSIAWPYAGSVQLTQALLPTPLQLGGTVSS